MRQLRPVRPFMRMASGPKASSAKGGTGSPITRGPSGRARTIGRCVKIAQKLIEPLRRHRTEHALVVVEDDRRIAARTHALAFTQRDAPVCRRLAEVDSELVLQMLGGDRGALQRARQI